MEALGGLGWLANNTRPDIAPAVHEVARFMSKPKKQHWSAIKTIFQYVKGTSKFGIWIRKCNDKQQLGVCCYVDASWGTVSIGGYLVFLNTSLVCWSSQRIRSICLSSYESEIVTMSAAAAHLKWFARLVSKVELWDPCPIPLYCDNQGSIDSAGNSQQSTRTRHIEIKNLFVREAVKSKLVATIKVASLDNWSDFLTKNPGPVSFKMQVNRLGMELSSKPIFPRITAGKFKNSDEEPPVAHQGGASRRKV